MSTGYSSREFMCPFFKWDKKTEVHCEGAVIALPKKEFNQYVEKYCCSYRGYHKCSVAKALFQYYERTEKKDEKGR